MIEINKNELTFYCSSCHDKKQRNVSTLIKGIFYDKEENLFLEFFCKKCNDYNCLKFNEENKEKYKELEASEFFDYEPYQACEFDSEQIL
jgi:ribosomal protein L44E